MKAIKPFNFFLLVEMPIYLMVTIRRYSETLVIPNKTWDAILIYVIQTTKKYSFVRKIIPDMDTDNPWVQLHSMMSTNVDQYKLFTEMITKMALHIMKQSSSIYKNHTFLQNIRYLNIAVDEMVISCLWIIRLLSALVALVYLVHRTAILFRLTTNPNLTSTLPCQLYFSTNISTLIGYVHWNFAPS